MDGVNMKPTTSDLRPQTQDPRMSFTLVEMLAVVAIIATLAGVLYPALRQVREAPKRAQARTDIRKLELALQNYYGEYGRWPDTSGVAASDNNFITMLNGCRDAYTGALAGVGTYASNSNPRYVRFMEVDKKQSHASGLFLDPWGIPYIILLDNGQNSIGYSTAYSGLGAPVGGNWADPTPGDGLLRNRHNFVNGIRNSVAIYSFGPNKLDDLAPGLEWDDITSWY